MCPRENYLVSPIHHVIEDDPMLVLTVEFDEGLTDTLTVKRGSSLQVFQSV